MTKPDPKNLLNWTSISEVLAGHEQSIRRDRIPIKHRAAIKELLDYLEAWQKRAKKH